MSQSAARTLQERPLRLAVKAALRGPHEGPHPIPRKAVWMGLGISEATYSRWLDDEHPQLPDLLELVAIVNITRAPGVLGVICCWAGDGYEVAPATGSPAMETKDAHRLMAEAVAADAAFMVGLAEALRGDGKVDRFEATELLDIARAKQSQGSEVVETLERVAKGLGVEPLRLAQ